MKNFKLVIEYDGTRYHGWQRQKKDRTIQGEIERALLTITGRKISLIGSGRTDSGVHALGQTANFKCDTHHGVDVFFSALNALLADDIIVKSCEAVDNNFHARYSAKSKTYQYRIYNNPLPKAIGRQYAWFIRRPLNIEAMDKAGKFLSGRHDFKSFEGAGSPRSSTKRTVTKAEIRYSEDNYIVFKIEANGFLRFMVRNIVGTLVEIGLGKRNAGEMKSILRKCDRSLAGATAPAHGLFLVNVTY